MTTKRLSFEEARAALHRQSTLPSLGLGCVWAYNYDPNGQVGEWDPMTGFVSADDLDEQYGPFALTESYDDSNLHLTAEAGFTEDELSLFKKDSEEALDELKAGQEQYGYAVQPDFIQRCLLEGSFYDKRFDLDHELHDSEHPNHHKYCNFLSVGHFHVRPDLEQEGDQQNWLNVEDRLDLSTVRFTPQQALDRLASFISIFEDDGMTDVTTLDTALAALQGLLNQLDPEHEDYQGH